MDTSPHWNDSESCSLQEGFKGRSLKSVGVLDLRASSSVSKANVSSPVALDAALNPLVSLIVRIGERAKENWLPLARYDGIEESPAWLAPIYLYCSSDDNNVFSVYSK